MNKHTTAMLVAGALVLGLALGGLTTAFAVSLAPAVVTGTAYSAAPTPIAPSPAAVQTVAPQSGNTTGVSASQPTPAPSGTAVSRKSVSSPRSTTRANRTCCRTRGASGSSSKRGSGYCGW